MYDIISHIVSRQVENIILFFQYSFIESIEQNVYGTNNMCYYYIYMNIKIIYDNIINNEYNYLFLTNFRSNRVMCVCVPLVHPMVSNGLMGFDK